MEELETLKEKHKSLVQKYIDSTEKILKLPFKLEWYYFENENVGVFAYHKNFQIFVNIYAIEKAINDNKLKWIEYFIIHETFHIFQKISIAKNDHNPVVAAWKHNFDNYIKPTDNKNDYYLQPVEFDAFVYAYAVILYKYKNAEYVKYPEFYYIYDDYYREFTMAVNSCLKQLEMQNS